VPGAYTLRFPITSIKPVKNKSENHTKFYIGYGVINHSEKHGIFGKNFFGRFDPQNDRQNRPKPVFWIFELLPQHKKFR